MPTEPDASLEKISLKTGVEVTGVYKKLHKDDNQISLIIELADRRKVQTSFPDDSAEAKILQKALRCVKHGIKIKILKQNDSKRPIDITKIPNLRTKRFTFYLNAKVAERLEPYQEPGGNPATGVTKLLDIVENKLQIVAVKIGDKFQCNKMQKIGKIDTYYCSHLGAIVSRKYCLGKCTVASQLRKISGGRN